VLPKSMMLALTSEKRDEEQVDDAAAPAAVSGQPARAVRLMMITRRENAR
jgi:hypothetical protein